MLKFSRQALARGVGLFVNAYESSDLVLRLYASDSGQVPATRSNFVELSGHGYAPVTLHGSEWRISGENITAIHPEVEFVFTGEAGIVAGYFLTRADGEFSGHDPFASGPVLIQNNGDKIVISPSISLEAEG